MDFVQLLNKHQFILMEGGTTERLRRNPGLVFNDHVQITGLLLDKEGRKELAHILDGYIRIGQKSGLPLIVGAPTWRAGQERCSLAGLKGQGLNQEAVQFAREARQGFGEYADHVVVAGYLACKGDCYLPAQALETEEARAYHAWQTERLAEAGADLLFGATLPALSEALGMARAMAATGTPYLLSFVIRPWGVLLDGTPLNQALDRIDQTVDPAPSAYMVNCVHPSVLDQALERAPKAAPRLAGLQANTSDKAPEELEGSEETETMDPEEFGQTMWGMHDKWGLKILGGCCGTDDRHIQALADLAAASAA